MTEKACYFLGKEVSLGKIEIAKTRILCVVFYFPLVLMNLQ